MNESILDSIKKRLGLPKEYTPFDPDVIMDINSSFMSLRQLGVGPDKGFSITGSDETWESFLGSYELDFEAVKTYIYLKVRLSFDPPATSFVLESINRQIQELEWRMNMQSEEVLKDG